MNICIKILKKPCFKLQELKIQFYFYLKKHLYFLSDIYLFYYSNVDLQNGSCQSINVIINLTGH
jgi:hypothetical protein